MTERFVVACMECGVPEDVREQIVTLKAELGLARLSLTEAIKLAGDRLADNDNLTDLLTERGMQAGQFMDERDEATALLRRWRDWKELEWDTEADQAWRDTDAFLKELDNE